jgi:SAM-dependent methyltransferase
MCSVSSGVTVRLRCPDCGKAVDARAGTATCGGCERRFAPESGVWDLLPRALGRVQANEDRAHVDVGEQTWRRLFFHKRYWLEWCERRWLPTIIDHRTRTFLEIGGGLCYASALAKQRAPQAFVLATDVSPRYLRQHAVRVGEILGTPADTYAAVDAERLPFEDGQFDAIYSQIVLYRLPDPARALREIRRVLAPGGRYLGIERASPWARPFFAREVAAMRRRAERQEIAERPLTFSQWSGLLSDCRIDQSAVRLLPGTRLQSLALQRLANAVRAKYIAVTIAA